MKLDVDAVVQQLRGNLPNVNLIYLFGSEATDSATSSSDIDIAVWSTTSIPNTQRWHVAQLLAARLGRDVDLVDLAQCSTVLRFQIVSEGKLLWDDGSAAEFEVVSLSQYQHLQESRQPMIDEYVKRKLYG